MQQQSFTKDWLPFETGWGAAVARTCQKYPFTQFRITLLLYNTKGRSLVYAILCIFLVENGDFLAKQS
jgi:hypothetical protein